MSLNLYTYCHNDPINYVDPTGRTETCDTKLSKDDQDRISQLTKDYYAAKKSGDLQSAEDAHRAAVAIRESSGRLGDYEDEYNYHTREQSGNGSSSYSEGSSGAAVEAIQMALIRDKEKKYNLSKYGADGDFGKYTKGAVIRYQIDNKLKYDGIVGEKTSTSLGISLAQYASSPGNKADTDKPKVAVNHNGVPYSSTTTTIYYSPAPGKNSSQGSGNSQGMGRSQSGRTDEEDSRYATKGTGKNTTSQELQETNWIISIPNNYAKTEVKYNVKGTDGYSLVQITDQQNGYDVRRGIMNTNLETPSFTMDENGMSVSGGVSASLVDAKMEPMKVGTKDVNVTFSSTSSLGYAEAGGKAVLSISEVGLGASAEASILRGEANIQLNIFDFKVTLVPSVSLGTAQYGRGAFMNPETMRTRGASAKNGVGLLGFGLEIK